MAKEPTEPDLFGDMEPDGSDLPPRSENIKQMFRVRVNPLVSISLEQIFIAVIVLLILFVLAFMMGVLRGKSIQYRNHSTSVKTFVTPIAPAAVTEAALAGRDVRSIAPTRPNGVPQTAPATNVAPKSTAARPSVQAFANDPAKPYTIQVVTYRSEERALKEISYLQAKGYVPRMISLKGYSILCVGQYANRKEADRDVKSLKTRYKDCYLRKI